MMLPSNTPPDGDFVRYIEKLTLANAQMATDAERAHLSEKQAPVAVTQTPRRVPASHPSASPAPLAANPANADPAAALKSFLKEFPVLTHFKWLVGLWIALQVLGEVVPAASYLLVPALLGYVAWVVVTANQRSSGALFTRVREWSRAAAEEAKKAREAHEAPQAQQAQAMRQKPPRLPK